MNDENLIPGYHKITVEEASKGGRASGRARRIKSTGRKLVRDLLALRQPDPKIVADLERYGVNVKDLTNEVAMTLRQLDKAIRRADTVAYNAVLKAAGYLTEDINIGAQAGTTIEVKMADPAAAEGLQRALQNGAQPAPPANETNAD